MRKLFHVPCLVTALACSLDASTGGPYEITPSVLDGGGGLAAGPAYDTLASFESSVIGRSSSAHYEAAHGYLQQSGSLIAGVIARHLFYNDSAWDRDFAGSNAADDEAIAADKTALLQGTATFANYSSYWLGINGLLVDIFNLPPGELSAVDFKFKIGNTSTPDAWIAAQDPSIVLIRRSAGVGGSDRVTLIWSDADAPRKTWLRVEVLATAATGLSSSSVFYFGNAIGESGNSTGDARVTTTDELLPRNHPASVLNPAAIDNPYDYNRDRRVTTTDQLIARSNPSSVLTELRLITVSDGSSMALATASSPSRETREEVANGALPVRKREVEPSRRKAQAPQR